MSNPVRQSKVLDYLLLVLLLPVAVWIELNEASRDISLALTGGKYEGYGRINRKRYSYDDDPDPEWLRPPNYSRQNFHRTVWRAKNKKYIEKRSDANGMPELVLTKPGRDKVLKTFPLLKLAGKLWKGWWLVVTFDIPEIDRKIRKSVRDQLTHIGFVRWQKSVYVSPHDIADDLAKLLRENNLQDKVVPMISKRILCGNDWEFARRVFRIDQIEAEYHKLAKSLESSQSDESDPGEFFRRKFSLYVNILKRDPLLPMGLAPKTGYGRELAQKAILDYAARMKIDTKAKTG